MTSYKPVDAVVRGLQVLSAVSRLSGKASVGELHRETGYNKATIVRTLETLVHEGFVSRHPTLPLYHVTGKTLLLSLGYDLHKAVGEAVSPIVAAFRNEHGWPSDVAIPDSDAMLVVETSREAGPLSLNRRPGYRAPIMATSLGLAYAAYCDADKRAAILDQEAKRETRWSALSRDRDAAEIMFKDVREQSYAVMHPDYSRTEYGNQISAIAVPIIVNGSPVAAMNVLFLKQTLSIDQAISTLLPHLKTSAQSAGERLVGIPFGGLSH